MEKECLVYCTRRVPIEYDQPTLELPLYDYPQKKKKERENSFEIYKEKEIPLVPDSNDLFDITDKFEISKKNTFQM